MTRWKKFKLLGLALTAAGLVGCKQQLFERECDLDHYRNQALKLGARPNLDTDIGAAVQPGQWDVPPPATVSSPDREPRYLTLQEAIAIALEQGTTGFLTLGGGLGQGNENVQSGRTGTFSDSVRVLAFDPAAAGADIEAALSKFDARWLTSQTWGKVDNASPGLIQSFQNGDTYNLNTGIYKPLPTGGVAGITFNMDYLRSDNPGAFLGPVNPIYRPRLQFQFEQPLLQNYGVEINQLLVAHPGTTQIPRFRPPGGRVEGILVARVRYEQAKAEFERNINHMLLNVEAAYWNLWASYGLLLSRNEGLIEAYEVWRAISERAKTGLQEPHEVARTRAQLEQFRVLRYQALGQVLENERHLRLLLGLADDNMRLIPVDQPTQALYEPDWANAVREALELRPELVQARQDLKVRQFDVLVQKNQLKPDLRFFANYDINGIGDQLDGGLFQFDPNSIDGRSFSNALGSMALNKFNSWQFGFLLDVPIGYRDAHSAVRVARLNLLRSFAALRDNERKVLHQLRNQYARLNEYQLTIVAQQAQYVAAKEQYENLRARKELQALPTTLEQVLNAQRVKADARAQWFRAVADYNTALAGFQFAKGTIRQYDNVVIGEGPLPECAQVRAADHFRERTKALILRERSGHVDGPAGAINIERDPLEGVMPMNIESPPSVLQMLRNVPQPQLQPAAPAGTAPVPAAPAATIPPSTSATPGLLPGFGTPVPASTNYGTPAMPTMPAGVTIGLPQRPPGLHDPVPGAMAPR